MLSSGTRIGPTRIVKWLGEGSCGQSYRCIDNEGHKKDKEFYVKLISREISEKKGFQDYFTQELQAIEQLEGPGIWPIHNFGITKWKHWINYIWHDGFEVKKLGNEDFAQNQIRDLNDLCKCSPGEITPGQVLSIMISLHRGLYKAHIAGVCHGNLKPSNILLQKNEDGDWEGMITELGLYRINLYRSELESEDFSNDYLVENLEGRISSEESQKYRPKGILPDLLPDESWDLYALGKIVNLLISESCQKTKLTGLWDEWNAWLKKATGENEDDRFSSCAHSMDSMPGVGQISRFGIKVEEIKIRNSYDTEELRIQREKKFKNDEKKASLKTKRGITGLAGGLSLVFFILYSLYLLWAPTPWTEYSLEGSLDSYQMGVGFLTGQAWGIVPGIYDEDGNGGQDVVGEWKREDGLFKLQFKRFKKSLEEKSGKKLWQFIGNSGTTNDDYFIWSDYLEYDSQENSLKLIKRQDEDHVYIPGSGENGIVSLYPEERLILGDEKIKKSELKFLREKQSKISWSLFFAVGFGLACLLYHREFKKLEQICD
jgi:serine/threonine protein kinase